MERAPGHIDDVVEHGCATKLLAIAKSRSATETEREAASVAVATLLIYGTRDHAAYAINRGAASVLAVMMTRPGGATRAKFAAAQAVLKLRDSDAHVAASSSNKSGVVVLSARAELLAASMLAALESMRLHGWRDVVRITRHGPHSGIGNRSICSGAGAGSGSGSGSGAGAGAGAGPSAGVGASSGGNVPPWSALGRGLAGDTSSDRRCRPFGCGLGRMAPLLLAHITACLSDVELGVAQRVCVKLRCAALKTLHCRRGAAAGRWSARFADAVAALSLFPLCIGDELPLMPDLAEPNAVINGCTITPATCTITDKRARTCTLAMRVVCFDEPSLAVYAARNRVRPFNSASPDEYKVDDDVVTFPVDVCHSRLGAVCDNRMVARPVGRATSGGLVMLVSIQLTMVGAQRLIPGSITQDPRPARARRLRDDEFAQAATAGVSWADGAVLDALAASINNRIDALMEAHEPDCLPGSDGTVRGVDPTWYPYVAGTSALEPSAQLTAPPHSSELGVWRYKDVTGRPCQTVYQLLPAPFLISESGECSIGAYINNLPRDGNEGLYADLAALFEAMLPRFESVVGRASSDAQAPRPRAEARPALLRGRELQVITKIVEYELPQGSSYEGEWRVEGLRHEHIIATGVYVAARSGVQGGALKLQRRFRKCEKERLRASLGSDLTLPEARSLLEQDCVPLGHIGRPAGRMFVFPNTYAQMESPMRGVGAGGRLRVVVFSLVHPRWKLVSTREVLPQQGVMGVLEARAHRVKLLEERRLGWQ